MCLAAISLVFLGSCSDTDGCENVQDRSQAYGVMSLHFKAILLLLLVIDYIVTAAVSMCT